MTAHAADCPCHECQPYTEWMGEAPPRLTLRLEERVCEACGHTVAPDCPHCGKRLGAEYHELGGTHNDQCKFFFRDCADCGQLVMRMVNSWR